MTEPDDVPHVEVHAEPAVASGAPIPDPDELELPEDDDGLD